VLVLYLILSFSATFRFKPDEIDVCEQLVHIGSIPTLMGFHVGCLHAQFQELSNSILRVFSQPVSCVYIKVNAIAFTVNQFN
jgi:hypothetical protein